MRAYISALDLILFATLVGHVDDPDAPSSVQKRYSIADRPRRRPATVPAHHNVVQPERRLLNVGNDDDRPPGIEQRGFDNIFLDRILYRWVVCYRRARRSSSAAIRQTRARGSDEGRRASGIRRNHLL